MGADLAETRCGRERPSRASAVGGRAGEPARSSGALGAAMVEGMQGQGVGARSSTALYSL